MLNKNMKVLFVANIYFAKYKHFCVALKSHYIKVTTSFDSVGKHSIMKPDLRWAYTCNFSRST